MDDLIVEVPVGTIFRNLERQILAELTTEGAMMIAARVRALHKLRNAVRGGGSLGHILEA